MSGGVRQVWCQLRCNTFTEKCFLFTMGTVFVCFFPEQLLKHLYLWSFHRMPLLSPTTVKRSSDFQASFTLARLSSNRSTRGQHRVKSSSQQATWRRRRRLWKTSLLRKFRHRLKFFLVSLELSTTLPPVINCGTAPLCLFLRSGNLSGVRTKVLIHFRICVLYLIFARFWIHYSCCINQHLFIHDLAPSTALWSHKLPLRSIIHCIQQQKI